MRIAVLGSGFAGSIAARIFRRQGHHVVLIERGTHPRFALGESSTPLAAICLERLADRYDLPDLRDLAAYGRWTRAMPNVRRGLKRGFTFYGHRPDTAFTNDDQNSHRLLVAASPNDEVADAHWVRSDVDHRLLLLAVGDGVEYLDHTALTDVDRAAGAWQLTGTRHGAPISVPADLVIDATGSGGFLPSRLDIGAAPRATELTTRLLYGHFRGVARFADVVTRTAAMPSGPYPDDRAAIHHLLDEGWMYQLPFDDGVVSAGFILVTSGKPERRDPTEEWQALLSRYPSLASQFAEAEPLVGVGEIPLLQRRLASSAGPDWALLPHTFSFMSPMFSTGIAWSLVAVERLADACERPSDLPERLAAYDRLLQIEAEHIERLIAGAYLRRADFDAFAAYSMLYFTAASFAEASQRLCDAPSDSGWGWEGFLCATDPVISGLLDELHSAPAHGDDGPQLHRLRERLAGRNVAGLFDPAKRRLYPVNLDDLVRSASLLDLSPREVHAAIPRLRGMA